MKTIYRLNKLLYGLLIGLFLAMLTFMLVFFMVEYVPFFKKHLQDPRIPFLLAFIPNLLVMRYYFVNLKMEKTAKGILLITFIGVVLVFFFI